MTEVHTIVAAVFVFVASQYALKLVIEPVQEHRRAVAKIQSWLLANQARVTSHGRDPDLSTEAKDHAAELQATASAILGHGPVCFVRVFGLARLQDVLEACRELNGISADLDPRADAQAKGGLGGFEAVRKIGARLRIRTTYEGMA